MEQQSEVREMMFAIDQARRRLLQPRFTQLGLTLGQGQPRILKELREHGAMNQKELSDACLIEVTTMSRTIDRLEKMGLVKRESNPACRRSWTIALTEEGCEMADKVIEIFEMTDGIMKSGLSEDELEILSAGLEKVKSNLWTAIRNNEENTK